MDLPLKADLWNRQPGEGAKAYAAFCLFRDLGLERSLRAVSQKCAKSIPLLKRWSAKYRWVDRAAAWDDHQAEVEQQAWDCKCAKTARQHAQICMAGLGQAIDALATFKPTNFSEAVHAAINLMRFERLCRGLPSEIARMRHEGSSDGQPIRTQQLNITEVVVRNRKDIDDLRKMMGPGDRLLLDPPGPLSPPEEPQKPQPAVDDAGWR
jgi:hypothetical protein